MEEKHVEKKYDQKKIITILLVIQVILSFVAVFYLNDIHDVLVDGNQVVQEKSPTLVPSKVVEVSADDDSFKGDSNAPVTIIEFSDFECPFCGKFYSETLPLIEEKYISTGKVKFVVRDFPLSFHKSAQKAAEATECAGEQGKFWEMHDKLFENQKSLSVSNFKKWAGEIDLNQGSFNSCLDSGKMVSEISKDFSAGQAAGVSGTPSFFINGVKLSGAQPFSAFQKVIEEALKN